MMTTLPVRRSPQSYLRALVIVAAYLCAFVALDLVSRQFQESSGIVAWYPPAGLTYALLLVFGVGYTPGVTVALFISSVFVYRMPQSAPLLLLWALIISSTYGSAAAFVRHRTGFDWHLRRLRDVTGLIATAVLVSALLAVLSVGSSALSSNMPRDEVLRSMLIWWIGETVGTLTVTPFLLIHVMPWLKRFADGEPVRGHVSKPLVRPRLTVIGQALSLAFLFYLAFGVPGIGEFRPMYLTALPLIWIALDHGLKGATIAIVVLNLGVMLAMWFSRLDLAHLGEAQLLMIVNCIVGLPMGVVVTERRQGEEALRDSEAQFKATVDTLPLAIHLTTGVEQVTEYMNSTMIKLFGYTQEDIPTVAQWYPLAYPDERYRKQVVDEWTEKVRRAIETQSPIEPMEVVCTCRDGSKKNILWGYIAMGEKNYSYGLDLTDRKKAEAEKEALQMQLVQSQKMEAVGQLAGGVAHDFNNLLTGILGYVALIRSDVTSSDPMLPGLRAIDTAAHQAADLAKGLLTFSHKAVVRAVPLDLGKTVDGALSILGQSLPATMTIVRDIQPALWSVLADRSQITQVILNLALNSRDAMHSTGTLTIRAANEVVGQEYAQSHPLARIGEFVHLTVTDSGPGLPDEIREHLFEPFYTTKPAGSGTGLGLSIVYSAVKQANGWVTADSPASGGVVFDIFLPRCLDEPSPSAVPVHVSANICIGTILVAEDEPVVSAVAQSMLRRSGYTVLSCGDGGSALRSLQEHRGTVDLVLLDMTMPGMTTTEIVQAVRDVDVKVPILLTSGYASSDTVKRMLDAGSAQGFLGKPYEMLELLESVKLLLRRE